MSARAYIVGNKAYVRVDHPDFNSARFMGHEEGHNKIARGEINPDAVRDRIEQVMGEGKAAAASRMYAEAYEGFGLTAQEIWEEVICDANGNMNIFSESMNEAQAGEYLEQVRSAVDAETAKGRAPPAKDTNTNGKMSREKSYTGKNVEWAVERGVITEADRIAFFRMIANINKLGDKVRRTSYGGYIVELHNKLLFTDGDWHAPTLSAVITFFDNSETSMSIAKEVIFNGKHDEAGYEQARQIIESAYWPGYVERYTERDRSSYGRENAGGEGGNSRRDYGEVWDKVTEGEDDYSPDYAHWRNALKDNTASMADEEIGKMSREYWRTDLTKTQYSALMNWVKRDVETSDNSICETANWTYHEFREFGGLPVFAVYSTNNQNDPTILYEVKGEQAKYEKDVLKEYLERIKYGESINGESGIVGRVLSGSWVRHAGRTSDHNRTVGRGRGSGDAGVLQKSSRRKPSAAFESVLRNLIEDQERRGEHGRVNSGGSSVSDTSATGKMSREYWKTDLTKSQLEALLRWVKRDIQTSTNSICETENWTYREFREFGGLPVFAVYSTNNQDDPTILYEVKGEHAKFERGYLEIYLEDLNYGRNIDPKSEVINEVLRGSRVRHTGRTSDHNRTVGRGRGSGDAGVLQKSSRRKPSATFESVLRNLIEDQERRGEHGRVNSGGSSVSDTSATGKMSREYWRTDLTKTQYSALMNWVKRDVETSDNSICETENWTYYEFREFGGLPVFVVYSTNNQDAFPHSVRGKG